MKAEDNLISLSTSPIPRQESPLYKQSANVLFNFMPKLDYLKDKLRRMAMLPRYYEENLSYLQLPDFDRIAFPMVCFCDIHLNRLRDHMGTATSEAGYGRYGIGMDKHWGSANGVQPINYLIEQSPLIKDLKIALEHSITHIQSEESLDDILLNFLQTILIHTKPIEGKMSKRVGSEVKDIIKNFHDEREWRFIPRFEGVNTQLKLMISPELLKKSINNSICEAFSKGIERVRELWLPFEYEDIKYLIVDTVDDAKSLIEFIDEDLQINKINKYILVSKITIFTQLEKDW